MNLACLTGTAGLYNKLTECRYRAPRWLPSLRSAGSRKPPGHLARTFMQPGSARHIFDKHLPDAESLSESIQTGNTALLWLTFARLGWYSAMLTGPASSCGADYPTYVDWSCRVAWHDGGLRRFGLHGTEGNLRINEDIAKYPIQNESPALPQGLCSCEQKLLITPGPRSCLSCRSGG
ncbi:hypothetical protein PHLGIDRAFT_380567 [Phlebiopsis gigantea 11061_1 CR5-6]|uniref:Uncharacterized protein n=1 Tax=Phlebiopsis gigantea (strain 11061_1 CR5-6) TaxID=745531 RepID=A0A0C3PNK6_PHLG1|nr:hypothetical protein PHLGIDRAFT_380567 [Phlebiopsis gigantea 11061_1 CR5-6]